MLGKPNKTNEIMRKSANFRVDPKLAELLGETYRSIEEATKELIDNAYDADAEKVDVLLPAEFASNPEIIVEDNGSGMKENEVRNEYLNIANSRVSRKGKFTGEKKRKVKGRKGIGKFAGLMVASEMMLETSVAGKLTRLIIKKEELSKANYDLGNVPLPIQVEDSPKEKCGTRITLRGLNQNFNYPNPERLKEILIRDYGREQDFEISINGESIGVLDLQGQNYSKEITLSNGRSALLNYTITPKPVKQSGIVVRVNNKIIGRPRNFLDKDELIPKKLQSRVYGEIVCDDLEGETTADFGAIIENSKLFSEISQSTAEKLKDSVDEVFQTDMKMARARFQRKINRELEKLPDFKQPFAKKALYKVLDKFYGENEEKINTVISVMVAAMEKDHYWDIIQSIEETRGDDIESFASALSEFGLLEMSIVTSQAINRLRFLDEVSILIQNENALEKDIHKALEQSTWILGDDYSVLFSDTNLKDSIEKVLDKKYKGKNKSKRPDLLLGRKLSKSLLLIEFKRPSFKLTRDSERQAMQYKDELGLYFGNTPIEIILLGGTIDGNIKEVQGNVRYLTYRDIISIARQRLEWLINELKTK